MSKVAYISCPMTVSQAVLDEAIKKVNEFHVQVYYWPKGSSYDEADYRRLISHVDAFVIILPDVKWKMDYDKMTSGSRKELQHAMACHKPIYLFYKSTDGYHLYATDITVRNSNTNATIIVSISGIPSTKFNFKDNFDTGSSSKAIDEMYAGADFDLSVHRDKFAELKDTYSKDGKKIKTGVIQAGKSKDRDVEYIPDNRLLFLM